MSHTPAKSSLNLLPTASLLTAIVTDRGIVYPPFDVNLKKLFE